MQIKTLVNIVSCNIQYKESIFFTLIVFIINNKYYKFFFKKEIYNYN